MECTYAEMIQVQEMMEDRQGARTPLSELWWFSGLAPGRLIEVVKKRLKRARVSIAHEIKQTR